MFADAGTSVSSRLSVNSSNHSGDLANGLPLLVGCRFFWVREEKERESVFSGDRVCFPTRVRHFAKLLDSKLVDESCGNDVEDELALDLDDHPRKTRSTTFPSCKEPFTCSWPENTLKLLMITTHLWRCLSDIL